VAPNTEDEEESHFGRNVATGAAAVAPFAGMIGQKKILHDPRLNSSIPRGSNRQLLNAVQTGDVLVYQDRKKSVWSLGAQASGSDLFHTMPVVSGHGAKAKNTIAGEFDSLPKIRDRLLEMAPDRRVNEAYQHLDSVKQSLKDVGDPNNIVLLRPKVPMSPEQLKAFGDEAVRRGVPQYAPKKALKSFLHELLIPKLFGGSSKPDLNGDVCSTLVAESMNAAGRQVIDNKPARMAFPADFLRSEHYKPVIARVSGQAPGRIARSIPSIARAGLGLGLAGGAYAAYDNPALAAVPAGMMLGSSVGNSVGRALTGRGTPSLLGVLSRAGEPLSNMERLKLVSRYSMVRGLGAAAGGTAAYYAADALRRRVRERLSQESVKSAAASLASHLLG